MLALGNRSHFAKFHVRFPPPWQLFCWHERRVDNADAVEEVMQNVALAAIEQHPTQDDESKAPAWLYRVAVRLALLHRRGRFTFSPAYF